MANLSTIITGQTPLGGATEKNYVQAVDAPGVLWVASGAGVAVSLETAAGNLPESSTKKSAIKILRSSGSDYVRYRFILDKVDGSKTFKIQWAQLYSGAAGDYTISVVAFTDQGYSVGATTLPVTVSSIPAVNGVWTVTFNTLAYTIAPYVEIRVNAIAGATPLYISGVVVGPGITAQGAVITEWQTYTPTTNAGFVALTTPSFMFKRVGSDVLIKGSFTATTPSAVNSASISLPAGLTAGNIASGGVGAYGKYTANNATAPKVGNITVSTSFQPTYFFLDDNANSLPAANAIIENGVIVAVEACIPIAEWAGSGTVTLSSGAIVEYVWNSTSTATAGTYTTNKGSGLNGTPILNYSVTGTNAAAYECDFQYPIQSDDIIVLETDNGTSGARWTSWVDRIASFSVNDAGSTYYGTQVNIQSTTSIRVNFYSGIWGGAGWTGITTWRWRVRKAKASAPVGIDTSALSGGGGGGGSGFILSVKTSNFTAATLNHYLTDTSATAITATLPTGATSAAIKFSDDQRTWSIRPLTITPAVGEKIDGQAINEQFVCDVSGATLQLSWDGLKWVLDSNVIQSTVSITTGNALTEKNYITRPDSAATDWISSNAAQVTAVTESSTANLPENATKQTAIRILRTAGTASYVYTRMVLDSVDATKKMKLQWNQKFAGALGDFTLALFSFTSSDYSTGSTQLTLQSSTVSPLTGSFVTTFDAPASTAPYLELRIIAAAGTSPLYLSGVLAGPGIVVQGAAISEWVQFTPTGSWVTNTVYAGFYRRVGSQMEMKVQVAVIVGAPTAANLNINLPTGFTIDLTKITNAGANTDVFGYVHLVDAGVSHKRFGYAAWFSTTSLAIFAGSGASGSDDTNVSNTSPFTWGAGDSLWLNATVPIAEWAGQGTVNLLNQTTQSPIRAGTIEAFAGTVTPSGWLDCDGAAYLQTLYPQLYAQIGSTWNTCTNPLTGAAYSAPAAGSFRVPDLRSAFVRGAGGPNVAGVTTSLAGYQADTTAKNGLQNQASTVSGTVSYTQYGNGNTGHNAAPSGSGFASPDTANGTQAAMATNLVSGNAVAQGMTGDAETRPDNVGVKYIIKIWDESFNIAGFGLAGTDGSSGLVSPYAVGSGVVYSGSYTATFTAGTNVSGVTNGVANYTRIGNLVTVSGSGACACTATNTASTIFISLPIPSNLTVNTDANGTLTRDAAGTPMAAGFFTADTVNKRAQVTFNTSTYIVNAGVSYIFQYVLK